MKHELAFQGLLAPSLLLCMATGLILWTVIDRALTGTDMWRWFWRPPLARLALLAALIAATALGAPDFRAPDQGGDLSCSISAWR